MDFNRLGFNTVLTFFRNAIPGSDRRGGETEEEERENVPITMSGILREFVAFDENHHPDQRHPRAKEEGEEEKSRSSTLSDEESGRRTRRNATDEEKGAATASPAPPKTQKKKPTTANPMKNRIYTSQISYPSGNGAATNPGGRIL